MQASICPFARPGPILSLFSDAVRMTRCLSNCCWAAAEPRQSGLAIDAAVSTLTAARQIAKFAQANGVIPRGRADWRAMRAKSCRRFRPTPISASARALAALVSTLLYRVRLGAFDEDAL